MERRGDSSKQPPRTRQPPREMVGRPAPWARRPLAAAGARSQLPARAVASQIAGGGAHLGTSGLRCSRSSPSSVVPRPMLGGCGLGCELDEISSGRGSAAEINRKVWPPAGPRGPRNPNSMLLGDTPKSRAKGSATSDPATPRLPASHYLTLAGLQHDRKLLYEASASAALPSHWFGDLSVTVEPMSFRRT